MRAGASPTPRERVVDEIRLDRVPREIPARADQVLIAHDLARHRMSAEEVRLSSVAAVVLAGVVRMQSLECLRDACVWHSKDDVVVVAHQDVRDDREQELLADVRDAVEEVFAVPVVQEEVPLVAGV